MKLKELIYMMGIKPKARRYGYEIRRFNLPTYGSVEYAQWLHPKESEKEIREDAMNELRCFLSSGDFCIDIGAHTGDTTVPIGLAVGKAGCVLALEPNEYVYPVLKRNSTLNPDKTNIIPLMAAAVPQDGELEFEYSDPGFCNGGLHEGISKWKHGHAFKLKVHGINLSSKLRKEYAMYLKKLKYIKIDTEGYDLSILRSLSNIIDEFSPFIKTEIYKHRPLEYRRELYSFLSSRGYTVYKVLDDANLKEHKITPENLMNWRHYDIFCVPRATGNSIR